MIIIKRISEKDANLEFITGNNAFDELSPDGTLKIYLDQDIIRGGEYLTYLLFELEEEKEESSKLLALLRYKYTSIEDYTQELLTCNASEKDVLLIKEKVKNSILKIVYLGRIGVNQPFQEMNISQIMPSFLLWRQRFSRNSNYICRI